MTHTYLETNLIAMRQKNWHK